jgi:hypothetical protein
LADSPSLRGANRFASASLTNPDRSPPKGAILSTPLSKIVGRIGSRCRVLMLVAGRPHPLINQPFARCGLCNDCQLAAYRLPTCTRRTAMSVARTPGPIHDPAPSSTPANLADVATRQRLTPAAVEAVIRLAEIWRLTSAEACALLGDTSERTWFRMKKGEWSGTLSQDALTRVSALVGIFKGLRLLFSEPLSAEWIRLRNKGALYGGRPPLDTMIEGGIPKMLEARRHIDALRGGL